MPKPKSVKQPAKTRAQVNAHNKMVIRDLVVQAETLDSVTVTERSRVARRMLKNIHKLLPSSPPLGDALAADLEDSSYVVTSEPEIQVDGDLIFIHGHFSLKELAQRIVW